MIEWINKGESVSGLVIAKAERHYNAQYVADLCTRLPSGQWTDDPVAVFWCEKPEKPEYTNYLALKIRNGEIYVMDGLPAVSTIFRASMGKNGEIVFSRWRNDFRRSVDNTAMADGGREYFRGHGAGRYLKVIGPEFFVVDPSELVMDPT